MVIYRLHFDGISQNCHRVAVSQTKFHLLKQIKSNRVNKLLGILPEIYSYQKHNFKEIFLVFFDNLQRNFYISQSKQFIEDYKENLDILSAP